MKRVLIFSFVCMLFIFNNVFAQNKSVAKKTEIKIIPVSHASLILKSGVVTIVVDPVGDTAFYTLYRNPDFILITHEHGDHLDSNAISYIKGKKTKLIVTAAVKKIINSGLVLKNGDNKNFKTINIEAVPMYNTTEGRLNFHPRGNGNGYVITISGKRIYISGDTEDIPEMRALKNIDIAFVCMNLPYTMTEDQAASAVLEFAPKQVIPYHFRGKNGMSDIEKFKKSISVNPKIEVLELKWY